MGTVELDDNSWGVLHYVQPISHTQRHLIDNLKRLMKLEVDNPTICLALLMQV